MIWFFISIFILGPVEIAFFTSPLIAILFLVVFAAFGAGANWFFNAEGFENPKRKTVFSLLALYGVYSGAVGFFFLTLAGGMH